MDQHHGDLLDDAERAFIGRFALLPQASQALLVRMVMRKGALFRASKLHYGEIGCPRRAAAPLIEQGWIDAERELTLEQLFGLLTKGELLQLFGVTNSAGLRKAELFERLRADHDWPSPSGNGGRAPRTRCTACASTNFASGCACCSSAISIRTGRSSCWLIWAFIATSRCPFPRLTSVQFACRAGRLPASASLSRALRCRRAAGGDTGGCTGRAVRQCRLESRRGKLLLRIGQQFERLGQLDALRVHAFNGYPVRVSGQFVY